MKKLLLIAVPVLLSGCSVYNQLVERMQTDTLEYRCDEKPLTVKLNNPRQEASFVYDNKLLTLKQGISSLREKEQLVLSLYSEKELSMKEIAQVLNVSAPRISQIHSRAIEHLRQYMKQYMEAQ